MRRLASLLAASALAATGLSQWTHSSARAYALAGTATDDNSADSGQQNGLTEAIANSVAFMAGGEAYVKTVFVSDFAALRSRGIVRQDNQGIFTRGTALGTTDPLGAGQYFGGSFSDSVTIGRVGGSGNVVFQLHYALDGEVSHNGTGTPNWKATLYASAGGTNITQLNSPTTELTRTGSGPLQFSATDFYEFSAPVGSTLTVSGFLGTSLDIIREAADQGLSDSMMNAMNTGKFHIVTADSDATFTAASGHDYLTPVPEPASLAALGLGALVLFRRRRRV